jgi:citron Rho-interacting kinase
LGSGFASQRLSPTLPLLRFYLAEIAAGLNDLHESGFVHRDIKPENVLITRSGHIKLVDFGSAARLGPEGKVLESRLPVGTPEYIAPEVLTSLDHSADYGVCCDWWSLGIIAYELVYDVTPFSGSSTSETYGNIMNYQKSLSYPEGGKEASDELRDLVSGLLTSPDSRLAYSGLQTHSFFSSIDWTSLQHSLPPYIPSVCAPDDTANFEDFETQRDCGDDHLVTPLSQRGGQRGFSGKSLPFIGFTFTRMDSVNLNLSTSEEKYVESLGTLYVMANQ